MKRFFINSGYAMYLGFILGVLDISFVTWQFWVATVPTIILVELSRSYNDE